jgi:hypothetical protein
VTARLTATYHYPVEFVRHRKRNPETCWIQGTLGVELADIGDADPVMRTRYVRDRNSSWAAETAPVVDVVQKDGTFWRQATHEGSFARPGSTVPTDELAHSVLKGESAGDALLVPIRYRAGGRQGHDAPETYPAMEALARRIVSDGRKEAEEAILANARDMAVRDGNVYLRCDEPVLEEVSRYTDHYVVATMGGEMSLPARDRTYLRRADKVQDIVEAYRKAGYFDDGFTEDKFLIAAPEVLAAEYLSFDEDAHSMKVDGGKLLDWLTDHRMRSNSVSAARSIRLLQVAIPMLDGDERSVVRGASDIAAAAKLCAEDGSYHDAAFCIRVSERYQASFSPREREMDDISSTSTVRGLGFAFEVEASASTDAQEMLEALKSTPKVRSVQMAEGRMIVVVDEADEATAQELLRSVVDRLDAGNAPGF